MTALQANAQEPNRDSGKKGKRPKRRLFKVTLWKMAGGLTLPFLFYSLPCRNKAIESCPLSDPLSMTDVISLHKLQPVYQPRGV